TIQAPTSHDQSIHDRCAYGGNFSERAAKFTCGNMKYLRLIRGNSRRRQRGRSLQHGDVAEKIARMRGRENLLGAIALLESFQFAAQHNRQAKIALTRFE